MPEHARHKLMACLLLAVLYGTLASCATPAAPERSSEVERQVREQTLPLEWPVPPLTDEEVASAAECEFKMETLVLARYPATLGIDELAGVYVPESACDWAVLALAYARRCTNIEFLPEPAWEAFRKAVAQNPGCALATPVFYAYFGSIALVEPPPIADQDITDVEILYKWEGWGAIRYSVKIAQADADRKVSVRPRTLAGSRPEVDRSLVQALAPALSDLLPTDSQFTLSPCYDNYPEWSVSLTFADGTTLIMESDSNFLHVGGPWQTSIDGQTYVQYSAAFVAALLDLVESLELPLGRPAGMACLGNRHSILDMAFSRGRYE